TRGAAHQAAKIAGIRKDCARRCMRLVARVRILVNRSSLYDGRSMDARQWESGLDAMLRRIDTTGAAVTEGLPHYGDPTTGRWPASPAGDWTGGFWNGLCWLAAHVTGKDQYRDWALAWTERLCPRALSDTVFRGFLFYYGALLGAVVLGDPRAREIALAGAAGWARSYNAKAGAF